ncbi:MAG: AAA family ATPase [Solirubrobacterales bacterium]|nr:AAA family ATPase [Solirubrobacterales bacterium]
MQTFPAGITRRPGRTGGDGAVVVFGGCLADNGSVLGARVELLGRDGELAAMEEFFAARDRLPAALVVRGEPGIGKTSVWREGVRMARERGLCVLVAAPGESEAQVSFAALGDLLSDVLAPVLGGLRVQQRHALEVALRIAEVDPGVSARFDQGAVSFAFLSALRGLAAEAPVLLAVDDVQWLDVASATVLSFAVRRLGDDRIGLFLSQRVEREDPVALGVERALEPDRLTVLRLGPLTIGAVQRLLHTSLASALPRPVLARVYELSGGNPFFALELARARERGSITLEPGGGLPVSLEALVRDRIAALPIEARRSLAAAAAMPLATVTLVDAVSGGGLGPGLDARIVELDGDLVRFAHPLLRWAAYAWLPSAERRELHRRLANVVEDVEEQAWQLALACERPDSEVAGRLEDAAAHAYARGATVAAAELAARALALTPTTEASAREERTLKAAEYHFEAGDSRPARELLEGLIDSAPAGRLRARAFARLARMSNYIAGPRVSGERFRRALAEVGNDPVLRGEIEEGLAWSLVLLRDQLSAAEAHAQAAVDLAQALGDGSHACEALTVRAVARFYQGRGAPARLMRPALELEHATGDLPVRRQPRLPFAALLMLADELVAARENLELVWRQAEQRGEDGFLPLILSRLSYCEWLAGDWDRARELALEGYEAALRTEQPSQQAIVRAARAVVEAHLGDVDATYAAAGECLALADQTSAVGGCAASGALGVLELSLGDVEQASRHLGPMLAGVLPGGIGEPDEGRFGPYAVEALLSLGRAQDAADGIANLQGLARAPHSPSLGAALERCRGLLALGRGDTAAALSRLEHAINLGDRIPIPFERARTVLALGAAQRRAKQRAAARRSLEQALESFDRLGARLWAERTRDELARIGGRAPSPDALSASERRVAVLVAAGHTNREVAAELFLSVHTVEKALTRIYAKLGIRSRTELARKLAVKE